MRICHVTPHLPPDQGANALLPYHLGAWARDAGDEPMYVAHPARAGGTVALPGPVTWIALERDPGVTGARAKLESLALGCRIWRLAAPAIERADLVHLHSNGLLTEICAAQARWKRKRVVLTLYGTEIWHYRVRRLAPDLFARAYRSASLVTFYSRALSLRAEELGLVPRRGAVTYPPVAEQFTWHDRAAQAQVRERLGIRQAHVLLNVKRLHPLAGQRDLIVALGDVLQAHPDTRLVICGSGPLRDALEATARDCGVAGHVTFAGLVDNRAVAEYYAASDLFVLPSVLEACPTVALEALAAGTPVISSDNPGGLELHELFGDDVTVVPRSNPAALAAAIAAALAAKRRTLPATQDVIERTFRPRVVAQQFRTLYDELRASES